ncbi:hypothetical protein SH1V18_12640 [Vallitalea longa]|uniref:Methyltransferase type 11 domain-containing protein n=1 Tax=Vallitalea longa TaxID=2936439 RepID=A0A9W5Y923_9FIRM|nr:methyltransferase domain-containing protein [Vallitalea longa]GKX28784.1 hypothetical protein SH1V18_12640 [Vallitalea longa]
MHKYCMDLLVCPLCKKNLEWNIIDESDNRIINAEVKCLSCGAEYEVRNEIAVFLTDALSRNDLWENVESGLDKYFKENPDKYDKLMNTPEDKLSAADYWYKAVYLESKSNYKKSTSMFQSAMEKIYTKDYVDGWNSQMNYIVDIIENDHPIVDIASGKGYLVEKLLANKDNYVIATDFSPTILMRNKDYYIFKGLYDKLSLIAFDARKTPFKNNSIVNLTSNMGLQNIEQPGEVIKEMYRITKNNFTPIMTFIDNDDTVHMDLFNKFGSTAYATRKNATKTFTTAGWDMDICNSYLADIEPTPIGEIIESASIDGFPVQDTKIEYCVIHARKKEYS